MSVDGRIVSIATHTDSPCVKVVSTVLLMIWMLIRDISMSFLMMSALPDVLLLLIAKAGIHER